MKLVRGNYYSNIAVKFDDKNRKVYSDDKLNNRIIKLALFLGCDVTYNKLDNNDYMKYDEVTDDEDVVYVSCKRNRYLKIVKKSPFKNCFARIKTWFKGTKLNTSLGKIRDYFFVNDEEDEYEYENNEDWEISESIEAIYTLPVYDVLEYKFVIQMLNYGYTVIANLENLTPESKFLFTQKLKMELMEFGIVCHMLSENVLVVAPKTVEVIDFDDKKEKKGKIIYLEDYRNRKK